MLFRNVGKKTITFLQYKNLGFFLFGLRRCRYMDRFYCERNHGRFIHFWCGIPIK